MEKSPQAFRTISEVAQWLDTPAHVLRFWESRFPEVAPVKRAGGRRYYRPEDMRLLGGIKQLLHAEGHTIKAVQERLRSEGPDAVSALSQPLEAVNAAAVDAAPTDRAAARSGAASADGTMPVATPAHDDAPAPGRPRPDPDDPDALPPIGFFFDDSEDAPPAAGQSGTFAPDPDAPPAPDSGGPEGEADAEAADPAASAAGAAGADAPAPGATLPEDPPEAPAAPPVPPAWRDLRGLERGRLSEGRRRTLAAAAQRLAALRGRMG